MRWAGLVWAAWLAATLSGWTGSGGALLLLPALTLAEGARAAVPLLTVAQLFGNGSRAWYGRSEIAWRAVGLFTVGSVPGALTGALLLSRLPEAWAGRLIGGLLLVLLVIRRGRGTRRAWPEAALAPSGFGLGVLSAVAGSAGPLQAVVFLGLGLTPGAFIATEAAAAGALHLAKTLAYGRLALLTPELLPLALLLGAAMVAGSWTGRRLLERTPPGVLRGLIEGLLALAGVGLLVTGG